MDLSPLMFDACIWAQMTNWSLRLLCSVVEKRRILPPALPLDHVCLLGECVFVCVCRGRDAWIIDLVPSRFETLHTSN